MGAMLVGMATAIPAMILLIFFTIVQACVISYCAYKNNMSVKWWLLASFMLNSWVILPFVFAVTKTKTQKCKSCGTKVKYKTQFCPECGENIKVFDDEGFIRKILIALVVVFFCILTVEMIYLTFTA